MNDIGDRQKPTGFTRLFRAFGASMKGFAGAFREEAAFRQELALAVVVIPLGLWLGRNGIERALLIAPMFLVLIVELLNSAIEATVDRIGLERHTVVGPRQGHRFRGGAHVTAAAGGDLGPDPVALSS